jgi:hypothetical protein
VVGGQLRQQPRQVLVAGDALRDLVQLADLPGGRARGSEGQRLMIAHRRRRHVVTQGVGRGAVLVELPVEAAGRVLGAGLEQAAVAADVAQRARIEAGADRDPDLDRAALVLCAGEVLGVLPARTAEAVLGALLHHLIDALLLAEHAAVVAHAVGLGLQLAGLAGAAHGVDHEAAALHVGDAALEQVVVTGALLALVHADTLERLAAVVAVLV